MYIENQRGGADPHDKVSGTACECHRPRQKGIRLAQEASLPQQIIDFIPQHPGTRVLAYSSIRRSLAEERGDLQGGRLPLSDQNLRAGKRSS
jgi:membrane-associated HD superfamily phosphohydrolase